MLGKIQTQASELTDKQLQDFLIPLLEDMMTVVDISSSETQECFQSLVTTYITRIVGKEPKRPNDWARPEEATEGCYLKCDACREMQKFLRNPISETHDIHVDNRWHLRCHFGNDLEIGTETMDGLTSLTVTKILQWWEKEHKKWETRASNARETLQKLASSAPLKECLAHKYDKIMDLRLLKADRFYETKSILPQKRPGNEDL